MKPWHKFQSNKTKIVRRRSVKKAIDVAVGMELTEKEINQFSIEKQVNKVESQECFRCGRNKIIHQISTSTKIQNAIFARKKTPNAPS